MFQKITNWFQGRHTFFIVACIVIGSTMAWFHRLDANLVTLLLGLQGMILGHSIKDDHYGNN